MSRTSQHEFHQYDSLFYRYQREGSARSALAVLPLILSQLKITSALDVGCGAAAWLSGYQRLGVADLLGIDGDYVDRSLLMVDAARFQPRNITQAFDLGRQFDIVQCLEVAEHVPPATSATLVDNIVRHSKCVLFSAAVPGQGGEDHINERSYAYWRDLFAERGYRLFDFVRPPIQQNSEIESWYRYNLLFFVHDSLIASLPAAISRCRVADSEPVPDIAPLPYRVRKWILRLLPEAAVSQIAVWKHRQAVRALRQSA